MEHGTSLTENKMRRARNTPPGKMGMTLPMWRIACKKIPRKTEGFFKTFPAHPESCGVRRVPRIGVLAGLCLSR
jgi:hypothetical protein